SGASTKMTDIDSAVMRPSWKSARSAPTTFLRNSGNESDTTPIEKIVFARSYRTQPVTALRRTGGRSASATSAAVLATWLSYVDMFPDSREEGALSTFAPLDCGSQGFGGAARGRPRRHATPRPAFADEGRPPRRSACAR